MRVRATIDLEFEMNDGQPENAAKAALQRGLGDLRRGIEIWRYWHADWREAGIGARRYCTGTNNLISTHVRFGHNI